MANFVRRNKMYKKTYQPKPMTDEEIRKWADAFTAHLIGVEKEMVRSEFIRLSRERRSRQNEKRF
jgi:hypothetical protein